MNWISENKFLAGFFGFMIVAVAALGYLLYSAMGNYTDTHQDYTTKLGQLKNLQNLTPTRNQANLDKYKGQKAELGKVIGDLEQNLYAIQFPLDPTVTPEKFQDQLRTSRDAVTATAATNSVKLPDKFALGFDKYLNEPPVKEAAAPLARELKAVEFVVNELLDTRVDSIGSTSQLVRAPLPEETHAKPSTAQVVKSSLEISFVADQGKVRKVLNDLAETKKQFYIVRLITIKNQGDKQLTKKDALAHKLTSKGNLNYVLGAEKLEVSLKLDIVNFNPPPK